MLLVFLNASVYEEFVGKGDTRQLATPGPQSLAHLLFLCMTTDAMGALHHITPSINLTRAESKQQSVCLAYVRLWVQSSELK